jgi:hypothetical protein
VSSFVRAGAEVPPLVTDGARWRRVRFTAYGEALFQSMTGAHETFRAKDDAAKHEISLTRDADDGARESWVLSYERLDADHLRLRGTFRGEAVEAATSRMDEARLPLWTRGFHWVTERPFNQ